MCQLLQQHARVARKPHRCIWCGFPIEVKSTYLDIRMVNDEAGCVETQHWHPECNEVLLEEIRYQGGGCLYFDPYGGERPEKRSVA